MRIKGILYPIGDQLADYFDIHGIYYTYQVDEADQTIDMNIQNPHKLTVTYKGDQFEQWLIFKAENTNDTFTVHMKELIKIVLF